MRLKYIISFMILLLLLVFTGCSDNNELEDSVYDFYQNDNYSIKIEHFFNKESPLEYWISTITPKDKRALKYLVKKSFACSFYNRSNRENPREHADRLGAKFAINASGWNVRNRDAIVGVQVKDGIVLKNKTTKGRSRYTLGMDKNGIMNVFNGNLTGRELVLHHNIENTFSFSIPIIINGQEVSQEIYDLYSPSYKQNHPRQIVGQVFNTNQIIILTVDGRSSRSKGMTLKECASILLKRNIRVAYNLDGGGSVQTIYKGEFLNNPADGSYRETSDLLYFN